LKSPGNKFSVPALFSDRQLREEVIKLVQTTCQKLPRNASISDIENCFPLRVYEDILPLDKDGAYIEEESKIVINKLVTSEERRQFTLYHELVHYLIRSDNDLYSYLHDAYPKTMHFDRTIELVCNIGAAELILPRENVRSLIAQKGFSLSLLLDLCQLGRVSGPAALIQLVECAPNQCYGVVCEHGILPIPADSNQKTFVDQSATNTLYILYEIWSPTVRYPIARFTRIPKDHMLFRNAPDQTIFKGKDRIPFRSGKNWQVPCEVCVFRNNIYALFHVTPPPDVQQPRLF
jgi:hypothetical protein